MINNEYIQFFQLIIDIFLKMTSFLNGMCKINAPFFLISEHICIKYSRYFLWK